MAALSVVPFSSVMKFKDMDATDIAKALHVGTLIEGSFSQENGQLKLDVNIVDTNKNQYLWSNSFQSLLAEFRSLIEHMVPKIAGALRLTAPKLTIGTQNTKAYVLFIHALALGLELTPENNSAAIDALKSATSLDPQFAEAHAALAEAYVNHFWWNMSNDTSWLDQAAADARKALALASNLPEGHFALAYALEGQGHRADAAREYFASVRGGPHYIPALSSVARYEFYMGDFDHSLATLDTIAGIDPTNISISARRCAISSPASFATAPPKTSLPKERAPRDPLTLVAFTHAWLKDFTSAERVLQTLEKQQPGVLSLYDPRLDRHHERRRRECPRASAAYRRTTADLRYPRRAGYVLCDPGRQGTGDHAAQQGREYRGADYASYNSDFFKVLRGDPRYQAILSTLASE